jgi:hypothetical protein
MKIVNISESPLLATEVRDILRSNPGIKLAFSERDPLDNPDITNPDELRRLVSARRTVGYIETVLEVPDRISRSIPASLRSLGLKPEQIARLLDSRAILRTPESAQVYIPLILGDTDVDVRDIIAVLTQEPEEPEAKRHVGSLDS